MSIRYHLNWADKLALSIALIIAGSAAFFWILGIIGLWGTSPLRFDYAVADWTIQIELVIVPLTWIILRGLDFAAGAVVRSRYSSRRERSDVPGPAFATPGTRRTV